MSSLNANGTIKLNSLGPSDDNALAPKIPTTKGNKNGEHTRICCSKYNASFVVEEE